MGAEQVVGLCPAVAASAAADGRLLEARLAGAAASEGANRSEQRGGEEEQVVEPRLELAVEAERVAHQLHDFVMGDGDVSVGALRSWDTAQLVVGEGTCARVQYQTH